MQNLIVVALIGVAAVSAAKPPSREQMEKVCSNPTGYKGIDLVKYNGTLTAFTLGVARNECAVLSVDFQIFKNGTLYYKVLVGPSSIKNPTYIKVGESYNQTGPIGDAGQKVYFFNAYDKNNMLIPEMHYALTCVKNNGGKKWVTFASPGSDLSKLRQVSMDAGFDPKACDKACANEFKNLCGPNKRQQMEQVCTDPKYNYMAVDLNKFTGNLTAFTLGVARNECGILPINFTMKNKMLTFMVRGMSTIKDYTYTMVGKSYSQTGPMGQEGNTAYFFTTMTKDMKPVPELLYALTCQKGGDKLWVTFAKPGSNSTKLRMITMDDGFNPAACDEACVGNALCTLK